MFEKFAAKKSRPILLGVIAIILVAALLFSSGILPSLQSNAVSLASEPRITERPDSDDFNSLEEWRAELDAWNAEQTTRDSVTAEALATMQSFLTGCSQEFLSSPDDKNQVCSPVNGYIALAMLAETTGGETRQQILDLLGADDLDTLRPQVSAVWESVYQNDGHEISVLANSLWLDADLSYVQEAMDTLAYYHYASVYQGDFGTGKTDKAIQSWLNSNTAGLLEDSVNTISLPAETVMTLASTVYFQAKWVTQFDEKNNTQDLFHSPSGDLTCTYMNREEMQANYYWGDSFGAVSLPLKNGSRMWLILPDEDKTPADVLAQGQYMEMVTDNTAFSETSSKYMKVNLSLPKFDVSSSADLKSGLQSLGITDIFDITAADFSPSIESSLPVYLSGVNQAARVIIDEEGVKAASYIEMPTAGAAAPPEEIIDFILDRPFLFIIADYSGIPLFAGVVNKP